MLAFAIGGCGSSSHSTTSTKTAAARAVAAKPTKVTGVPTPKGAIAPANGGLAKLVRVTKGVSAHIQGIDNAPITQAIPALSRDLNQFWSQEFASSGVQWPTVQDVLVQTSPVQTQCSSKPTAPPTDAMFLCYGQPATFFWTVPWMQQNVDTDPGGVNLAFGMAGMYADAVQDLFGFYQQLQQGHITTSQWQQQNICLVGIWALSLNNRKLFEQADVQIVKNWLNALSGGNASDAATSQQLQQAFLAGFNSGTPSTCGVQSSGGSTTTTTTTTTTP
jgi:predicted metalloprotease